MTRYARPSLCVHLTYTRIHYHHTVYISIVSCTVYVCTQRWHRYFEVQQYCSGCRLGLLMAYQKDQSIQLTTAVIYFLKE
jgi:hypothetical protein